MFNNLLQCKEYMTYVRMKYYMDEHRSSKKVLYTMSLFLRQSQAFYETTCECYYTK